MRFRRYPVMVAAFAITLAACGSTSSQPTSTASRSTPSTPSTSAPAPTPTSTSALPDVDVFDVATGDTVSFSALAPAEKPILLWFWAPH